MAQKKQLTPVFVPPLAALLARAESVKASRLTESEVLRIRDGASCVMMNPEDANKLIETRGYRDVNPESCWADWHRLRVEMTGNGYLPKIILCVPGGKDFPANAAPILTAAGNEHEWRKRDKRMREAFEAAEFRLRPSLQDRDWVSIDEHRSVLYVLSDNFTAHQAPVVSQSLLQLGRRLLEVGGSAIKCESCGIAHSQARWIELAQRAEKTTDAGTRWTALVEAFVQYPISSEEDLYTCGMHLLGQPDLIVGAAEVSALAASELFAVFAQYLLAECPEGAFVSGDTFSVSQDAARYRVVWEACTAYDEDEYFFNPFGRWRFTALS
jgi:hypothetical protein